MFLSDITRNDAPAGSVLVVRHAVLRYCSTLPRNLQLYVTREYCIVIFCLC